jgi:fucose permease
MTLGCLAGLFFLKLFDSRRVLVFSGICTAITLSMALYGSAEVALICFPLTGLFLSVVWGIIFSLALNSVPRHHGTFSGILCTAIVGGAVMPLIIGGISEFLGLRAAMGILFLTIGYIISVGMWARPLITNSTIKDWKKIFRTQEV